jgi:hypothetical protein
MTAKQRTTRRLTGLPSWPILLLAGREKAGKSYSAAEAAGSDLIGRVLWIGIGEDDPDEYGSLPGGDRIELVEHDGTYRDILAAAEWAAEQPPTGGKPTLIVLDSMTRLWNLLSDMAQDTATRRAKEKSKRVNEDGEGDITPDLWNTAADRWQGVMDALRAHRGPVIVTARMDEVAVIENGKPTTKKTDKIQAHKSLVYDVAGIVEMPERGKAFLTGVRTLRMKVPHKIPLTGFTVDKLWRDLGLAELRTGERSHTGIDRADMDPVTTQRVMLLGKIRESVNGDNDRLRAIQRDWAHAHDGENIAETRDIEALQELVTELQASAAADELPIGGAA